MHFSPHRTSFQVLCICVNLEFDTFSLEEKLAQRKARLAEIQAQQSALTTANKPGSEREMQKLQAKLVGWLLFSMASFSIWLTVHQPTFSWLLSCLFNGDKFDESWQFNARLYWGLIGQGISFLYTHDYLVNWQIPGIMISLNGYWASYEPV